MTVRPRKKLLVTPWAFTGIPVLFMLTTGCTVDEVPAGLKRTPAGSGPVVRFDLYHDPLPEIPLPNDAAMWPDPTSRTGLRINASVVAPTDIEAVAREKFDTLEGWGTFAAITVAFDGGTSAQGGAAVDLESVRQRHQGDDYEFENDVVYLINLATGVPVPLDLGEGSFQYVVREKSRYFRNDTRRLEQNLLWETADETVDPLTGAPDPARQSYRPELDTDFDGVLDRPNLLGPACPNQIELGLVLSDPLLSDEQKELAEVERDQCIADRLLTWYERETDTLIARPLIPLEEATEYAVVITDRLVDGAGQPVRSPFDYVYHPAQEPGVTRLLAHLTNPALASYFGDIGGSGLTHVAFAWTFTTQPVVEDLRVIRDGLYGQGPLARLGEQFPARAELMRAIGTTDLDSLAAGAEEPPNWQQSPECQDVWNKFFVLQFDKTTDAFRQFAGEAFGFTGPSGDELIRSLENVAHVAIGSFHSPFFISGGPQGTDPNASFNMDFRTGQGELHSDTVQFLIAVPKESTEHKQPFPVAYYGHGYTSSIVEVLGFAGNLAQQGIASIGMNATFHQLELGEAELLLAKGLFASTCAAPFMNALVSGRARDLDGDTAPDSGGDYWTSYLFHTRDVVRQSAVDLLQMFRVLKSFDGRTTDQDFDLEAPGEQNIAGDFDGNGVPDVGGPDVEYYAWGQSLGGILAPFVAALDPKVVASAPTAGAAGLLDVGARTFQGGAFEGIYLRNFGPLVVGVPATELAAEDTRCDQRPGVASLRFVVVDVNDEREVEFGCLDLTAAGGAGLPAGGTVVVANRSNGRLRCARIDPAGRFRIGIPSSRGDRLEVALWDVPDAVDSYGESGCRVSLGREHRVALISTWGKGPVAAGTTATQGGQERVVCSAPDGCSRFQDQYYASGDPLLSIAEGFGHIRQTPALRRFLNLASNVIDPGDPVNYVPFFSLRPIADPFGEQHPAKGMLNVATIGDMNVPINSGISIGRVAGAVPFLRPSAAARYPHHADYMTPAELYVELGQRTPNRVLIDNHVIEGINRLRRHPPSNSCGANEVPLSAEITACHAECSSGSDCLEGQQCVQSRCVIVTPSARECAMSLFDVDVLDEGAALYGETEAARPLRVARVSMPATPTTLGEIWEPRLMGTPFSADQTAWSADQRVVAQLMAYTRPLGEHGFSPTDPCQNWQTGRYMINLLGRFFATSGADVYYLSHPSSHPCLGRPIGQGHCPFVLDLRQP